MTYLGGYSAQAPHSLSVISFSHRHATKHNPSKKPNMVHPGRFELPTARFVAEYSIQLSYGCTGDY